MGQSAQEPDSCASAPPGSIPRCFEDDLGWLLAQCFRAYVLAMDRAVGDFPHGHRGFHALSGAANHSAHNQAALAKQLGVDRTVMVYLVDDLEKAGLVERLPDPNDRRSRLIRATDSGRTRLGEVREAISAAEAGLLAALGEDEQKSLRVLLRRLAAHQYPGADQAATACDAAQEVRAASV
jgi:MarR family transcriptional regulator for hemolysin